MPKSLQKYTPSLMSLTLLHRISHIKTKTKLVRAMLDIDLIITNRMGLMEIGIRAFILALVAVPQKLKLPTASNRGSDMTRVDHTARLQCFRATSLSDSRVGGLIAQYTSTI